MWNNSSGFDSDNVFVADSRVEWFLLFSKYYLFAMIFVGLVGNSVSIAGFLTSPRVRSVSVSNYLFMLAISDICFLLMLCLILVEPIGLEWAKIPGLCQTAYFIWYLSSFLSGWYTLAVSCERCLVVYRPFMARRITLPMTMGIITLISLFGGLINSWITLMIRPQVITLEYTNEKAERWVCGESELARNAALYSVFNTLDAVISFTIPLFVVFILNIFIILRLCKAKSNRQILAPSVIVHRRKFGTVSRAWITNYMSVKRDSTIRKASVINQRILNSGVSMRRKLFYRRNSRVPQTEPQGGQPQPQQHHRLGLSPVTVNNEFDGRGCRNMIHRRRSSTIIQGDLTTKKFLQADRQQCSFTEISGLESPLTTPRGRATAIIPSKTQKLDNNDDTNTTWDDGITTILDNGNTFSDGEDIPPTIPKRGQGSFLSSPSVKRYGKSVLTIFNNNNSNADPYNPDPVAAGIVPTIHNIDNNNDCNSHRTPSISSSFKCSSKYHHSSTIISNNNNNNNNNNSQQLMACSASCDSRRSTSQPPNPSLNRKNESKEGKITLTLLSVSLTYCTLNLPNYALRILDDFFFKQSEEGGGDYGAVDWRMIVFREASQLLFYTQFSVNFLFYSYHWYTQRGRAADKRRRRRRDGSRQGFGGSSSPINTTWNATTRSPHLINSSRNTINSNNKFRTHAFGGGSSPILAAGARHRASSAYNSTVTLVPPIKFRSKAKSSLI